MSEALLTDLYQLTMSCGYWRAGIAERRAAFHLFYRRAPFDGGYAIAAGLEDALRWLEDLRFDDADLSYLAGLTQPDGAPTFPEAFLDFLGTATPSLDVAAVPEGTVVFPHEPMLRVEGPLWQAQLVETALLTFLNFQTLVATKAARICRAASAPDGTREPVLEFGLRRAQGPDGAMGATRAAFIGGCSATSHLLAGQTLGIPVAGTHAHSWVTSFPDERSAFRAYAEAFPSGAVFLVDTYDTLGGVRAAIDVAREMRARGRELLGVRLDSGDLAALAEEARAMLDAAGFPAVAVVASNDLDEHRIAALKAAGAPIGVWGVGTRLVTAYDQPSLGGVYKQGAVLEEGRWMPRMKLSENPVKRSIPGRLGVRRYADAAGRWLADAILDLDEPPAEGPLVLVDPEDPERRLTLPVDAIGTELLAPVLQRGQRVDGSPTLASIRERSLAQQAAMPAAVARNAAPERHFVGLEARLAARRETLRHSHEETP
ncbi:MAG: nicotinate phosphoribosyltransferase [Myxococcota bacterium]